MDSARALDALPLRRLRPARREIRPRQSQRDHRAGNDLTTSSTLPYRTARALSAPNYNYAQMPESDAEVVKAGRPSAQNHTTTPMYTLPEPEKHKEPSVLSPLPDPRKQRGDVSFAVEIEQRLVDVKHL